MNRLFPTQGGPNSTEATVCDADNWPSETLA